MLEKASLEEIAKLRHMPGKEVDILDVRTVELGTMVRVKTASWNHYLFEVTDPAAHRAHVVRCEERKYASTTGYRGERLISPIFRIGDQITHGGSITSAVDGITILPKEVLS